MNTFLNHIKVAQSALENDLLTCAPYSRFSLFTVISVRVVVRVLVATDMITIPVSVQHTAKERPAKDFGVLSPYLQKQKGNDFKYCLSNKILEICLKKC